ncbi:MAG: glycine-rich protein [Bacteroidota bacterium]
MKRGTYKLSSRVKQTFFALALTVFMATAYSQQTYIFNYQGSVQTINLLPGCYKIDCWGADGADGSYYSAMSPNSLINGGKGGYSTGSITINAATSLFIYVGGKGSNLLAGNNPGGYNGGGNSSSTQYVAGSGGGASHVATASGLLNTLSANQPAVWIVAGGGGGGGNQSIGGNGGGLNGIQPPNSTQYSNRTAGGGGSQTTGGACYFGGSGAGFGQGGTTIQNLAGGGGGGWYGGCSGDNSTGGGGGSGYFSSIMNGLTVQSGQSGFVSNPDIIKNGHVIITHIGTISTIAAKNPICAGESTTLTTSAIGNYVWSNGANSSSIVVSPTVTTSYTLTATSSSSCTASAVITVSVDSTPTVTALISPSVVCVNKPVTITASGAGSYTWTGGITNGVAYTPTASGTYTYAVNGANACGTSTAAVSLTVNPLPIITASINNPIVCSGSSIILNGGGSVSGYTWSAGAPNNAAFVPATTTSYVVTGTGSNGCANTAAVGVTVLITPTITPVVTPTAICFGSNATLTAIGATGFTWTPGSFPNTYTIVVSPPVPTTYTVVRTNGPCSSSSTVHLVVFPIPLMNASATPSQICAGTGANLVVAGPVTNTWLPGGFTTANFTVYPNVSTNYTVTGSNGNCTATAVVPIVVNPSPTITISSSTNIICQGNNITLTGNGGLSYTWQPMNTNNTTEIVSPSTTTIITLSGSNSFGCTSAVNQLIQVFPLPNTNLTGSSSYICVGQTATISLTNPVNNVVYNWSTGAYGTSISANPGVTTTYFVTGTNTITGCVNTNTFALSVYIATFVVTSPTAICNGQTTTLTATGPASSYVWTANGGTPIAIGAQSVAVSPVTTTNYSVTGTTGNCSSQQAFSLIVHPLPNVTAQTAKKQICRLEVSTITGNGATSYSWNTGATTATINVTPNVTTTYTLTGTDLNGCSMTTTVTQFVATCIGVEDFEMKGTGGLMVYPNPNNGNFTIRSVEKISISIINTLGQVISTLSLGDNNGNEVTVNSLPTGVYFITAQKNGLTLTAKIIVER